MPYSIVGKDRYYVHVHCRIGKQSTDQTHLSQHALKIQYSSN